MSLKTKPFDITHDDSLYPSVLSEAHCLLQGCLDSNGQEDQNLKSSPIVRQVLVLRRVRPAEAGQSYYYRLETRLTAVGCTCVRPIVNPQLVSSCLSPSRSSTGLPVHLPQFLVGVSTVFLTLFGQSFLSDFPLMLSPLGQVLQQLRLLTLEGDRFLLKDTVVR
ncbi:hypothetical protein INR49_028710 [Caranx melampygus]|nr:hypothetical protein INR49_028710 [Caranx melampygus]